MGLLEALKQYASDAAGGSLNPEVRNTLSGLLNYGKDRAKYIGGLLDDSSPINKDFKNWHDRTQIGLADLIAGKEGPQADYGYSQIMNMAGVAPVGMTAWHGSPHKFDKFSLDKIGTGEGAQAYGHGLYLAEGKPVAQSYAEGLSIPEIVAGSERYSAKMDPLTDPRRQAYNVLTQAFQNQSSNPYGLALQYARDNISDPDVLRQVTKHLGDWEAKGAKMESGGNLYKTDIPDEAVARFLDWDKPLSQQAPEVRAYAEKVLASEIQAAKSSANGWGDLSKPFSLMDEMTGSQFLQRLRDGKSTVDNILGGGGNDVSNALRQAGIPGIRYLDGGSRSAGQGSSNFVLFDPEMIRILERNGQPTGLEPWKPGEYRLGDLLK